MGWFYSLIIISQMIFLFLSFIPVVYWLRHKFVSKEIEVSAIKTTSLDEMHILLPMRNEIKNVERKINSVIHEIIDHDDVKLIVIDSNSTDNTGDVAVNCLHESKLPASRWKVKKVGISGKNVAINSVIGGIKEGIIVISDADAKVRPGWLDIIRERLSDDSIGAISGIEAPTVSSEFNSYYRRNSNWLKCEESKFGSTPILEGSILAWKSSRLGSFKLNCKFNADDAQIAFICMRRGYRSIVDPGIEFSHFESKSRTFRESIRRSQGLSLVLINNIDILLSKIQRLHKSSILNSIILYLVLPWSSLFLLLSALTTSIFMSETGYFSQGILFTSIFSLIIFQQARHLMKGIWISICAHILAIIGVRFNTWEPVR